MNAIHARSQLRYWPTSGKGTPMLARGSATAERSAAAEPARRTRIMSASMSLTRRHWLLTVTAGACGALVPSRSMAIQGDSSSELEQRIGRLINEYGEQGIHRTATAVDRRSADWLCEEV